MFIAFINIKTFSINQIPTMLTSKKTMCSFIIDCFRIPKSEIQTKK